MTPWGFFVPPIALPMPSTPSIAVPLAQDCMPNIKPVVHAWTPPQGAAQ